MWHEKRGVIMILLLFFLLTSMNVQAAEKNEKKETGLDLDNISRELEKLNPEGSLPDFQSVFELVMQFQWKKAAKQIIEEMTDYLFREIDYSRQIVPGFLGIVIFSLLFTKISEAFTKYNVGEYGFLVSYFLIFLMLFSHFQMVSDLYEDLLLLIFEFMKIVIPVYTLAITLTGKVTTATLSYEYFMIVVLLIYAICLRIVLPLVEYYLILSWVNNFSSRTNISKLCDTIYLFLSKGIRVLMYAFFGLHTLELVLAPSFDGINYKILDKMTGIIPGAGSIVQTVAGTVLASAVFVKNTFGVTTIIFLLLITMLPLTKILLFVLLYLFLTIVLEPVADSRLIRCLEAVRKSSWLLFEALGMAVILFVIMIVLTCITTNMF